MIHTMTNKEIRQAIAARTSGTWDDPALLKFGPLLPDDAKDIAALQAMLQGTCESSSCLHTHNQCHERNTWEVKD